MTYSETRTGWGLALGWTRVYGKFICLWCRLASWPIETRTGWGFTLGWTRLYGFWTVDRIGASKSTRFYKWAAVFIFYWGKLSVHNKLLLVSKKKKTQNRNINSQFCLNFRLWKFVYCLQSKNSVSIKTWDKTDERCENHRLTGFNHLFFIANQSLVYSFNFPD